MAKPIRDSNFVRRKIEESINQAEQERHKKLLATRLGLARGGVACFKRGDVAGAVKNYLTYLKILEEVKNVGQGALSPSAFDLKQEMPELLMISGVYWDLVKIYDQAKGDKRPFLQYLEKYLIFSKGMPYQALCAESMRKYIMNDKPIHRDAFKSGYILLSGESRCFVATALVDVTQPQTLFQLRRFRDGVLRHSKPGRRFIVWYYHYGPKMAKLVRYLPHPMRRILGLALDGVARLLRN